MQDSLEDYLKLLKNTKTNNETPQIKKEVLITAHIKKECDQRAMKIVEFCIDGKLRTEIFLKCLRHIDQSHYQDIIEERALIKLCGYPICGKQIPVMPKKQYFISTKTNKVYDITDRKNYCSNHCYKASVHIKKQIDNSPLWLRKYEQLPKYDLLKKTDGGLPGEEVDQGIAKPVIEPSFTSITNFAQLSLDEVVENEIQSDKKTKITQNQMATIDETVEEQVDDDDKVDNQQNQNELKTTPDITKIQQKPTNKRKKRNDKIVDNSFIEIEIMKSMKEWLNLDTFIYIYGIERIQQIVDNEKLNNYFKQLQITELHIDQQKKYVEICKKLNLRELTDKKFDNNLINNPTILKPLPDYQQLKETSRQLDLKVKSFYTGVISIEDDNQTVEQDNEDDDGPPIVLPLVDVNSRMALRRNIFLKSLNTALQQQLSNLQIEPTMVLSDMQVLVKTFKLNANNIVFKPIVWNYIAIILLKILALKNEEIQEIFSRESSQLYVDSIMNRLPSKYKLLDDILGLMKNVDEFLQFYINSSENL